MKKDIKLETNIFGTAHYQINNKKQKDGYVKCFWLSGRINSFYQAKKDETHGIPIEFKHKSKY
jgi:hypothetical protein